jgi:TatD DNase family protein
MADSGELYRRRSGRGALKVKLVDSHCHLDDKQFDPDLPQVIERAVQAGVERMLAIGTGDGPPDLEAGLRLARQYPFIYATVGVHPHDAAKATPETLARLELLLAEEKVLALGEIGLDYHYDFSPREVQRQIFIEQLKLASRAAKPVVIHTREAWEDTMRLLRENFSGAGIMHCFTGGPKEAREALDLGFSLSFGGVLTFPKADDVREAARLTPGDRLLVETDAPYLAPVPHRGKRNEPAFLVETVRRLAGVRDTTPEDIAELTTSNLEALLFAPSPH